MGKILLVLALLPLRAQANEVGPDPDRCSFYLEAENKLQCGQRGVDYLVNFGYKYCRRFLSERESWNDYLYGWAYYTSLCLQKTIQNEVEHFTSCESLEDHAFASHADCYEMNGFCELSLFERQRVYHTIDALDVARHFRETLDAYLQLMHRCRFSGKESASKNAASTTIF